MGSRIKGGDSHCGIVLSPGFLLWPGIPDPLHGCTVFVCMPGGQWGMSSERSFKWTPENLFRREGVKIDYGRSKNGERCNFGRWRRKVDLESRPWFPLID